MNTVDRLGEADDFWERVYFRIESMLADRDGSYPKLDDLDEMTPEGRRAANEKADEAEITYLRECVHDIVRDAIVVVTGWAQDTRNRVSDGDDEHRTLNSEEPCSELGRNIEQELRHLGVSVESYTQCAPSASFPSSCCADGCEREPLVAPQGNELTSDATYHGGSANQQKDAPSANDRARVGTVYYDEATHEYVMPPDFLGDKELRWKVASNTPESGRLPSCRDEATKVTDDVKNADPLPVSGGHGWHYVAGHRVVDGEDWYDVHEVYGFGGYTEDGIGAISESLDRLEETLGWMICDIRKYPVLELDELDATNGEEA